MKYGSTINANFCNLQCIQILQERVTSVLDNRIHFFKTLLFLRNEKYINSMLTSQLYWQSNSDTSLSLGNKFSKI